MTGVTLGHPKAVYRERLECCTVEISVAALNVGIGHQGASEAITLTVKFQSTAVIKIDDFSLTSIPLGSTALCPLI